MLREVTSAELTEWKAYYELEPFGAPAEDHRHGIATAALANVNRNAKKKPEPYEWTNFVPWHPANRETGPILLKDAEQQSILLKNFFSRYVPKE